MPTKNAFYAALEGIVNAMNDMGRKDLVYWSEYVVPTARQLGLGQIDLREEFGPDSVNLSGLDEMWYTSATVGAALVGNIAVYWHDMYMANAYPFEMIGQHAGKLHMKTGGQAQVPATFVINLSNQSPGLAEQHSDYEADSWYARLAGVKTVIPSTAYDAKGLMESALKSPDPVVVLWGGQVRAQSGEVPNESYEVPFGKAAIRTEGSDLTIVGSGQGMYDIQAAAETLRSKDGINAEVVDLRSLSPMDTETLVNSVSKTQRLLTVDQSKYTLAPGAEVVARVAEGVQGAKFKRIAYPDSPPPGAPEMFNWLRPSGENIRAAAQQLV